MLYRVLVVLNINQIKRLVLKSWGSSVEQEVAPAEANGCSSICQCTEELRLIKVRPIFVK